MSDNWAFNLDMLANNNVIDFDAPSYIRGQKPRYVGSPEKMPEDFIPNSSNLQQPQKDEFTPNENNENPVKNPAWKKWAFGALLIGGLGFAGYKFRGKLSPLWDKVKNAVKFDKIKQFCIDKAKLVGDFFKNGWEKFKGLFKRP